MALRKRKTTSEEKTPKEKKERREVNPNLVKYGKRLIGVLFTLVLVAMLFARIMPETDVLKTPENGITQAVTPIQNAFANVTDVVVSYLRKLKLRANLEIEYNKLKSEYDQLVYQAMLADELQNTLSVYQNLVGEMSLNESMQPIMATVIGQDEGNYTASITINKGSRDGIEDYMAVTLNGALVGYTYGTTETKSQVKAIIDTNASIPALIQSTRDQGTVRGTLGIDGKHMCRMYHADEYIPRPGDQVVTSGFDMPFPKGIPIGIVRESTRGMESNKQYIVVEPLVDFTHLEYVIVYRYQPTPELLQGGTSVVGSIDYVPLDTPRPIPTIQVGAASILGAATPTPGPGEEETGTEETTVAPSENLTPTPQVITTPDTSNNLSYNDPNASPTPVPEPTATPTPTPTQAITIDDLTLEEDN